VVDAVMTGAEHRSNNDKTDKFAADNTAEPPSDKIDMCAIDDTAHNPPTPPPRPCRRRPEARTYEEGRT
jgi:hypothetical protein